MPVILKSRNHHYDALRDERSTKKVGARGPDCLMLKELFTISVRGFTPAQHAHIVRCMECRTAYNAFMRIKRDEARMRDGFEPYQDIARRIFGDK